MDYLTRSAALARGATDRTLRTARSRGEITSILRGCSAQTDRWTSLSPDEQYRVRARAYADGATVVLSHESAAVMHSMPILRPDHTRIHVTRPARSGSVHSRQRRLYCTPLDDEDVTEIDGVHVTTAARTALDLACRGTFEQGVCAADSALRLGGDLNAALDRMGRRRGIAMARRCADFADSRSESIGESWSRAVMAGWPEVPSPRLQHEFVDRDGHFVARSDFDWDGTMVGEFDGVAKYGGRGEVVTREKRREDRLRALGVHVVRWGWNDLTSPESLRRTLRDGFALVRGRGPR